MTVESSGVSEETVGGTSLIACIMRCDDTPGCIATSFVGGLAYLYHVICMSILCRILVVFLLLFPIQILTRRL